MADLLQTGSDWLADQMKSHAAADVVYQRGLEQVAVKATIGRTDFEVDDGSGVIERIQSRDYLIQAADLELGGSEALPVAGDRIRETRGDKVFVYEVLAPGNEPCWRYSDPYRKVLRIHTKHVGTEST